MPREPGAGTGSGGVATVQQAVEQFVELHSSGAAPDPAEFAQRHPVDLRPQILAQCREFLAFDGLLGHQEWAPAERPQPEGRAFGDFVIQEELGRGGMGVVYLAYQKSLHRRVALKVMASGLTLSKRHVERFRREAAAAAQVRHPAIVPVHNLSEVDGTFAFAMDYIAGRNLADILDDLRLANGEHPASVEGSLGIAPEKGHVAECALLAAQLASALAAAHEAGVVHRDLKPRNVMVDDKRQARLLDFGLAKSLGEGSISMSGEITGTAHYMSPEQTLAKRVAVDHRADIFALGVILYELLTLKRPFDGKNLQQIVYEICFKEPVPPQKRNPKVPRDLATICGKALEKDPQNRYQTAAEFEDDLLRFLRWEPIHAKPAGPLTRTSKWIRRHRTESAAAAILLLLAGSVLGWQWYDAARREHDAEALLQAAEQEATHGHLAAAIQLATQALGKRNDEAGRARLALYHERNKTAAIQEEADIAEAARRSLKSSQAIDRGDRRLGVLLALAADDKRPSAETRSAVLDALGSGYATTTLGGHDHQVLRAEWSPDGTRVATTGDDGKVLLWDARTGETLRTFSGHSHWVTSAVFHPGGRLLLTASQDRTVRVWQLADGRVASIWQHDGAVSMLRLDRLGERALTVSYGGENGPYEVQLWNVATGERLGPTIDHPQHVMAAAISPDGSCAASWGGERGEVRLWDAGTGVERARLAGHVGRVQAIEFAPDGSVVATATKDGAVRFYSVPDGAFLDEVRHSRSVDCLAFDADGTRLLTGSRDLTARLWQLRRDPGGGLQASELRVFVGNTDQLLAVGFDRAGQLAVTAGKDGVVRIFDAGEHEVAIGSELMRYEIGAPVEEAAFDAESRRVLALAGRQRVLIWDFGDTRGVTTLRQPGQVPAACFDATGDRLVTAGDDERLRLWNAHDGRQLWVTDKLGNPIRALDVDAGGERIVLGMTDGRTAVHRLVDGAELFALPGHRGRITVARFVADGSRILVAGDADAQRSSGAVTLWNANDRTQVAELRRPRRVIGADLAPRQALLATVEDGEDCVRLWSVPDLAARGELRGHAAEVTSVHFATDGESVLTTSLDGTARIQRLDGTALATFVAGNPLHDAAWSRDGTRVLTSAERAGVEAQLWNVDDGGELLRFRGHRGAIGGTAFSPDAAWAATASSDGTTCVWPTDPVAVARRLPLRPLDANERRRHGLLDTSDRK